MLGFNASANNYIVKAGALCLIVTLKVGSQDTVFVVNYHSN